MDSFDSFIKCLDLSDADKQRIIYKRAVDSFIQTMKEAELDFEKDYQAYSTQELLRAIGELDRIIEKESTFVSFLLSDIARIQSGKMPKYYYYEVRTLPDDVIDPLDFIFGDKILTHLSTEICLVIYLSQRRKQRAPYKHTNVQTNRLCHTRLKLTSQFSTSTFKVE